MNLKLYKDNYIYNIGMEDPSGLLAQLVRAFGCYDF